MLIAGFNRNDAWLKYLCVQIQYTLLFRIKKHILIILSDIVRLIPEAPLLPFETYFHFFFLTTYSFKQRSGECNILHHFYFSTPEEQSCIVESCITERLPQERFIILENISETLMKVVFFFYFFLSCTFS